MWSVWNKQTNINGFSADRFLAKHTHLRDEETIFIKTIDGRITNVDGKNILAKVYGIDPALPNDEFITEYERILAEPIEDEEVTHESE